MLIPELRQRGIYPDANPDGNTLTAREKVYGKGQSGLRGDHAGAKYRYDVYDENVGYETEKKDIAARAEIPNLPERSQ